CGGIRSCRVPCVGACIILCALPLATLEELAAALGRGATGPRRCGAMAAAAHVPRPGPEPAPASSLTSRQQPSHRSRDDVGDRSESAASPDPREWCTRRRVACCREVKEEVSARWAGAGGHERQ